MKTFYVSLVGPLIGCYLQLEAENEKQIRVAMNCSRLKSLWCSVYAKPYEGSPRTPIIIPARLQELPENWHEFEQALETVGEQPIW